MNDDAVLQAAPAFLAGGGEIGMAVRAHDWSASPLGRTDTWPSVLRHTLSLMLNSPESMYLLWGPDLTFFFNDAYCPILGPRFEGALGQPIRQLWADAWGAVRPAVEQALAGQASRFEDAPISMARHGVPEQTWWSYSFSPVHDDAGQVAGVLCFTTETTARVQGEQRLAAEVSRQRRLLQQMPGFVCVLSGPDHVYDYVNDAYVTICGPRAFIGRSMRDVFPELEGQGFHELLDRVYATGQPFAARAMPIRLAGEDGDRFIDLLYQPIRDEADAVTGIFVGGYDVTEENRAAAALRELNADLERQVVERTQARGRTWQVSPDLMGALNARGYFETSNPAWQGLLGWSEAEVAGVSIWELLHPDDLERTRAACALTQAGRPIVQFPNRHRCKDGSYRWISWVGVPEDGLVYCTGRDITAEKQREAELAVRTAERDLLAKIVETTDVMVMVSDLDYNILAINQANADEFERIYGVRPRVGDNMLALLAGQPEHQAQVRATWGRGLSGEEVTFIEDFGDPDRGRPYYEIKFRTLRNEGGERIGCYQFVTDVTERLREQARLAEVQEALRQSQKMEAVGQLTGGIAHDFNNMLQAIGGSLELVQRRVEQGRAAEVARFVDSARGTVARAAALTHRLLAFARRQSLQPKPVVADTLILGMETLLRQTIGPAIAVELRMCDGTWPVLCDPNQLENVLLNLAINARDAMPAGGRLTITTRHVRLSRADIADQEGAAPGDFVEIAVADTGTGMDEATRARAFEPFFTTKPIGQGTGLGLSQLYGFVRQS
ncbi:MAG: PAS domain-containing protein, partial [Janthinobacterium lividum]